MVGRIKNGGILFILLAITVIFGLLSRVYASTSPRGDLIFSEEIYFSESEQGEVRSRLQGLADKYQSDFIVLFREGVGSQSGAKQTAIEFFETNDYGVGAERSGMLLLVDLRDRELYVLTHGKAEELITEKEWNKLLDAVVDNDIANQPYEAVMAYIEKIPYYFRGNFISGLDLLIAFGAAAVVALITMFSVKSTYKAANAKQAYAIENNAHADFERLEDTFIREYTTSHTKSSSSGSSSSGSGGGGSSGGGYGGGGRSF